jgi:cytochrome b involved in lipid metabolism
MNMNNKIVTILIGLILVAAVGWFVWHEKEESMQYQPSGQSTDTSASSESTNPNTGGTPSTDTPAQTDTPAASSGISAAEVATHATAQSCWSTINGNVYDLTSWIPEHPGGPQAILQLCGKDGSGKFNKQHGGAAMQAKVLAGFKIGAAAQ